MNAALVDGIVKAVLSSDPPPYTDDELVDLTIELVRKGNWRGDVYIRPMVYKCTEMVGVRLHDVEDDLLIFVTTLGAYLDFAVIVGTLLAVIRSRLRMRLN